MKGSVETILREGLIVPELVTTTNSTCCTAMDKKEIHHGQNEKMARQESTISEYFDSVPGLLELDDEDFQNPTPGDTLFPFPLSS